MKTSFLLKLFPHTKHTQQEQKEVNDETKFIQVRLLLDTNINFRPLFIDWKYIIYFIFSFIIVSYIYKM